jgi:outer membrane protein
MLKKLTIIIFSFLCFNSVISDDLKIIYIDIDKIINQSNAGKQVTKQLEILNNNNIKKFKNKEKELTDEENNIIKQKNILSKEDFDLKVKNLQKNIASFRLNVKSSKEDINKKKIDATSQILNALNPILSEYSSKNSISLILQKKNIVIGMSELDKTDKILEFVNTKIKSVKLN